MPGMEAMMAAMMNQPGMKVGNSKRPHQTSPLNGGLDREYYQHGLKFGIKIILDYSGFRVLGSGLGGG